MGNVGVREEKERVFDQNTKAFAFNIEPHLPEGMKYRDFNQKEDLVVNNSVCAVTAFNKVRIGKITNKSYINGICLIDDVMTRVEDIRYLILE